MSLGALPTKLNVNGHLYDINADYRAILQVISAYNDDALQDREKAYICLRQLYRDGLDQMNKDDYGAALTAANSFIQCGLQHDEDKPSPRIVDWEKDEQLIFPAINRVAGQEVRALPFVHWWTFLGWFQSIDHDNVWTMVLTIRQKKATGKKLEKYEKEFYNANKDMCVIERSRNRRLKTSTDRMNDAFERLLAAKHADEEGGSNG